MSEQPPEDHWSSFWASLGALESRLKGISAINVNSAATRSQARALVQQYFRGLRPHLESLHVAADYTAQLDSGLQRILELSNGNNRKDSYIRAIRDIKHARLALEADRELRIGRASQTPGSPPAVQTGLEAAIHATLLDIVPTAALSYSQAVADLRGPSRASYRGTAMELREALRELLDHLAPDDKVMKADGFKLEKGREGPTMRQKAAFILRNRGMSDSAVEAPRDAASIVDQSISRLARSVYSRGALDGHVAAARAEVLQLKLYFDSILAELLEIHS